MREGLFLVIMSDNEDLYHRLSFDYLIACVKNLNIPNWNDDFRKYHESEWKRLNPDKAYEAKRKWNEYSYFDGFKGPMFSCRIFTKLIHDGATFSGAILIGADFSDSDLKGADFTWANLQGADFSRAELEGANFREAHLEGANFTDSHLERTRFFMAQLEGAKFNTSHLERANFNLAFLDGAEFMSSNLEKVNFSASHLEGINFSNAHLEGAQFHLAVVNGETLFSNNTIDDKTDFTGTSLSSARIEPELRTQLERNIRQISWEEWYKDNKMLEIPARIFWKISDYGSSTRAILFTFLFSNVIFMMFYLALRDAGLLDGSILSSGNDLLLAYMQTTLVPFGILGIDLTTLSLFPVFIIFVQVIFGYTILAALVTRMAIMFQNLSP